MGTFFVEAAIIAAIAGVLALAFGLVSASFQDNDIHIVPSVVVSAVLFALVLGFPSVYLVQPSLTGVWGGYTFHVAIAILAVAIAGLVSYLYEQDKSFTGGTIGIFSGLAIIALLVFNLVNGFVVAGPSAVNTLKSLANVQKMSAHDTMPQVDPTHLVIVTQGIAYYKGQQSIGANGKNYGSQYQTSHDAYTLQSIQGHLYWVAPLGYRNGFNAIGDYDTPGYIAVDAEDPNGSAHLVDTYHFHYTPDGIFGKDLDRHVYQNGYADCNLVDPTLEIDDSGPKDAPWAGRPYFTISCAHPTVQYDGNKIDKVLVVDAQTGAVSSYAVDKTPAWVDRVYDVQTVKDYLTWWGHYSFGGGWFNPGGGKQVQPSDGDNPEILYTSVDNEPVYIEPLTSSNGSDQSSSGVMLCHTRVNQCDLYPFYGYGIGTNVIDTFTNIRQNTKGYSVATPQLMNLYGEPTWVATYYKGSDYGDIYQGVGIVDAAPGKLSTANVQFEPTLAQALADYSDYLANGQGGGTTATTQRNVVTLTGKIARIATVSDNGTVMYEFLLAGQPTVFKVSSTTYPLASFVHEGDDVSITYVDNKQPTAEVTHFDDKQIDSITAHQ